MPFCNHCGNKYSVGKKKCPECGAGLHVIPEGSSNIKNIEEVSNPKFKRFVAGLIDISIVFALVFFILLSKKIVMLILLRRGIAFFIPHLYLLLKDSIEGKSIGKVIMGVLVYNDKEKKVGGFIDSILRNWYLAIPILGPTVFAVLIGGQILIGKKRRLGDKRNGTLVITDRAMQKLK